MEPIASINPRYTLDVFYEILLRSPLETIINVCRTNKNITRICQSKYFWEQKLLHDFGLPSNLLSDKPFQIYRQLTIFDVSDLLYRAQRGKMALHYFNLNIPTMSSYYIQAKPERLGPSTNYNMYFINTYLRDNSIRTECIRWGQLNINDFSPDGIHLYYGYDLDIFSKYDILVNLRQVDTNLAKLFVNNLLDKVYIKYINNSFDPFTCLSTYDYFRTTLIVNNKYSMGSLCDPIYYELTPDNKNFVDMDALRELDETITIFYNDIKTLITLHK